MTNACSGDASVRSDRDQRRIERPGPLLDWRGNYAPDVLWHEVPADRLGEERHRGVTNQHLLGLQVLLVSPGGLYVGPRDAHKVVVLLVLVEGDIVGVARRGDVVAVGRGGVLRAPTPR